jgi:hypothetical protein
MILCVTTQLFLINIQGVIWPRYFLPVMVVIAMFLDVAFSSFNILNVVRIILAIIITIISFNACRQSVQVRQTNIDIIASKLEKLADKDDIIVINPWYFAVSFQRYYHGTAPFTTLPPIEDYKIHRYDLIKAKMASVDPIEPVLSEISKTLKSGGSVWLVGFVRGLPEDYSPQPLPPAPNSPYGWSETVYTTSWEQQFVYFILSHHGQGSVLPPVTDKPLNLFENCSITIVRGWQQ